MPPRSRTMASDAAENRPSACGQTCTGNRVQPVALLHGLSELLSDPSFASTTARAAAPWSAGTHQLHPETPKLARLGRNPSPA